MGFDSKNYGFIAMIRFSANGLDLSAGYTGPHYTVDPAPDFPFLNSGASPEFLDAALYHNFVIGQAVTLTVEDDGAPIASVLASTGFFIEQVFVGVLRSLLAVSRGMGHQEAHEDTCGL